MKLINRTLTFVSLSILAILTIWAVIFYLDMLDEIKGSIDEGLENHKRLIISRAEEDSTVLTQNFFDESLFTIRQIGEAEALSHYDKYEDVMLMMQDADDEEPELEPVRMLTSAFKVSNSYYELKVVNPMVEEDDLISALLRDVLLLFLALIVSVILVNRIVLKKLWKPFYGLLAQLKNFKLGISKTKPMVDTRTKEFQDLQKALNMLLDHSIRVFEQQKEFIGNASHELQTPLAIATNKVELLMESAELREDQAQNVSEIYQIIQRLIRLNKSLLLLSKIENQQFLTNQEFSINEIVKEVLDELSEFAEFKGIEFKLTEKALCKVQMEPDLARIVMLNLLKNAIVHNKPGGVVEVAIASGILEVKNTSDMGRLPDNLIFTRFYKEGKSEGSTGLGLAIVKAVADLYGFEISYQYQNDLHCFKLSFE